MEVGQAPQTQQLTSSCELPSAFAGAQIFPTRAPNRPTYVDHLHAFLHDAPETSVP